MLIEKRVALVALWNTRAALSLCPQQTLSRIRGTPGVREEEAGIRVVKRVHDCYTLLYNWWYKCYKIVITIVSILYICI